MLIAKSYKKVTVFSAIIMGQVKIVEDEFGLSKQPVSLETEMVKRFTFSNDNGVSVQVTK